MIAQDRSWMERALVLAERGRGRVEPNPLVGAVVVREGVVVGEGWHHEFGAAHAEVHALEQAGEAARGATLYVTLEPCCHYGKTPPCTETILKAGIVRVVAAHPDPFPQVAGEGAARLRAAGVQVEFGVGEEGARRLNAPYLKLLHKGRPYVHAKWAMSLDGKIATRTGDSQWISNPLSRQRVHALRGRMDGILVGIGTALADDPLLTARPAGLRTACRVVLDSQARLPVASQLVRTAAQFPTLLVTHISAPSRLAPLREAGCEVLTLPGDPAGKLDIGVLLDELGRRRWTNLLVEGGAEVLGNMLDLRAIDEVHVFVAPKLLGGTEARTPMRGLGIDKMADALQVQDWTCETIDTDFLLHGHLTSPD